LITFWNEIDKLSNTLGVSTSEVSQILAFDNRVSKYGTTKFGVPFGGKCLPKDLVQLIHYQSSKSLDTKLFKTIKEINDELIKNAN
jgi:UDP-glucose 6-dehydrogenase